MQFKRSLLFIGVTIVAVILAVLISGTLTAPKPESDQNTPSYKDGDSLNLTGELVCLPHREQSEVQTLECAYGFLDESGTYYGLEDGTTDYSLIANTHMGEKVQVEGTYRSSTDTKYKQNGTIRDTAISR